MRNIRRIATAALLTVACMGGAAAFSTAAHASRYWSAPVVEGKYWSTPSVSGKYWSGVPVTDGKYWSGKYWSAVPTASGSFRFAMTAVVV